MTETALTTDGGTDEGTDDGTDDGTDGGPRAATALRHDSHAGLAVAIALVASVVVTGFAGWVVKASLQQDFAAYWVAGAARRAGLDPYVNHGDGLAASRLWDGVAVFAHSRFLYPPVVAELFRPFARLPYFAAKMLFTALMVAAWLGASFGAARAGAGRGASAVTLAAGALCYPLYLALERGQIDPLVLLLLVVAFGARARPTVAGAALAAAAAFKPALVGVLLVLAALGRWRVVGASLVGLALVALASLAVSGPTLTREYATQVLPRAALYGEGGDETMLLAPARLAAHAEDLDAGVARLDGRVYRQAAWDGPASASLPRLLAPEHPTPASTRLPAALLLALLVLAARGARAPAPAAFILWAAAVACVIASPAGWVMGLVVVLPFVPALARVRGSKGRARLLGVAVVACACPPPFPGWAALAGAAVVMAAVALARALPAELG